MKTFTPIRGMIICSSGGEYVHISDYEILQQQIEDKEKEIAHLHKSCAVITQKFHNREQQIEEQKTITHNIKAGMGREIWNQASTIRSLEQQIEDLKCCGNCARSESDYYDECYTFIAENPKAFKAVCHKWKSDGLTAKEREI